MSAVEALDELIAQRLHPALVEQGLRRRGRLWWTGDDDSGWLIVGVTRWKYNDRDRAQFSVGTVVWPAGSWPVYKELNPFRARATRPDFDAHAPLSAEPADVLPERYGGLDWPWNIQVRPDRGLADEVVAYCIDRALPVARSQLEVDVAMRALTDLWRLWGPETRVWALIYACAIQERAAPEHARFAPIVTALRDLWVPDPRPADLRPLLQRWCGRAGVPFPGPS